MQCGRNDRLGGAAWVPAWQCDQGLASCRSIPKKARLDGHADTQEGHYHPDRVKPFTTILISHITRSITHNKCEREARDDGSSSVPCCVGRPPQGPRPRMEPRLDQRLRIAQYVQFTNTFVVFVSGFVYLVGSCGHGLLVLVVIDRVVHLA